MRADRDGRSLSAPMISDLDFLSAFESATLPEGQFRHADHVRAAWLCLKKEPPASALVRFSSALKRFAASHGKPDLYNETITWAYLLLINERLERAGRDLSWGEFATRNADLMSWKPSVLDQYYRSETLQSELAKRVFVLPDRVLPESPLISPDRGGQIG